MHGHASVAYAVSEWAHTWSATSSNSERTEQNGVGGDRPTGLAHTRRCDEPEEEEATQQECTSSSTGDAARVRSVQVGLRSAEHNGVSATTVGDWLSSTGASVEGSTRFRLEGDAKSSAVCRTGEPTSSSSGWAFSPATADDPSSCTSARLVLVDDLLLWVVAMLKIRMRLVNLQRGEDSSEQTHQSQSAYRRPQHTSALHGKRAV
jgi:hypothetical protein